MNQNSDLVGQRTPPSFPHWRQVDSLLDHLDELSQIPLLHSLAFSISLNFHHRDQTRDLSRVVTVLQMLPLFCQIPQVRSCLCFLLTSSRTSCFSILYKWQRQNQQLRRSLYPGGERQQSLGGRETANVAGASME